MDINNSLLRWRLYYEDGTTFSSADGDPEDAPPWGVVSAVCRDKDDPRHVNAMHGTGFDYYVWDGEEWWGVDQIGLIDRLASRKAKVVCFGRTISTTTFQEIVGRSTTDRLES